MAQASNSCERARMKSSASLGDFTPPRVRCNSAAAIADGKPREEAPPTSKAGPRPSANSACRLSRKYDASKTTVPRPLSGQTDSASSTSTGHPGARSAIVVVVVVVGGFPATAEAPVALASVQSSMSIRRRSRSPSTSAPSHGATSSHPFRSARRICNLLPSRRECSTSTSSSAVSPRCSAKATNSTPVVVTSLAQRLSAAPCTGTTVLEHGATCSFVRRPPAKRRPQRVTRLAMRGPAGSKPSTTRDDTKTGPS
mmetsp:Transcript_110046/g.350518  ORF Transcript_110046/g.350518 Transcript_110046/m.350518 type:complete len:255 (-) Transcript_110046:233-997(-)